MWGYTGEQMEDIAATVDLVKQCQPTLPDDGLLPHQEHCLLPEIAAIGGPGQEWAAATDRDFKIQGRQSRGYYKQADAWLRNEVEATRVATQDPDEAALKMGRGPRRARINARAGR